MQQPETALQIIFYLNVLSLTLFSIVIIGLFFCVDFFENIYDKFTCIFDDDFPVAFIQFAPVLNLFYILTYIFSTDNILLKVIIMFEFLYLFLYFATFLFFILIEVLKKLENVHNIIKYRKGK